MHVPKELVSYASFGLQVYSSSGLASFARFSNNRPFLDYLFALINSSRRGRAWPAATLVRRPVLRPPLHSLCKFLAEKMGEPGDRTRLRINVKSWWRRKVASKKIGMAVTEDSHSRSLSSSWSPVFSARSFEPRGTSSGRDEDTRSGRTSPYINRCSSERGRGARWTHCAVCSV